MTVLVASLFRKNRTLSNLQYCKINSMRNPGYLVEPMLITSSRMAPSRTIPTIEAPRIPMLVEWGASSGGFATLLSRGSAT